MLCICVTGFTGWSLRTFVKLTNLAFSPPHQRHGAGGILGSKLWSVWGVEFSFWRILRLTLLLLHWPPPNLNLIWRYCPNIARYLCTAQFILTILGLVKLGMCHELRIYKLSELRFTKSDNSSWNFNFSLLTPDPHLQFTQFIQWQVFGVTDIFTRSIWVQMFLSLDPNHALIMLTTNKTKS